MTGLALILDEGAPGVNADHARAAELYARVIQEGDNAVVIRSAVRRLAILQGGELSTDSEDDSS